LQRPTRIEVKGTGADAVPIMNHQYAYDAVSNIKSKTILDGAYRYDYDALDRLIEAQPPPNLQQVPSSLPVERFDYDAVHNRQSSGHQPGAWTYNANNEQKAWGSGAEQRTITYDQNGSTTKEVKGEPASETTDYVYDPQDRLIEVKKNNSTVAKYAYDPMGRRIWRQTSSETTWFLYSDEALIGEYTNSGAAIRNEAWLGDVNLDDGTAIPDPNNLFGNFTLAGQTKSINVSGSVVAGGGRGKFKAKGKAPASFKYEGTSTLLTWSGSVRVCGC